MGLKTILFDSPSNCYYPATKVTGKIDLNSNKPKKIRALTIKFIGAAKVKWTEWERVWQNDESQAETVLYSGKEEYFSYKYFVLGGESGELVIPTGYHSYSFSAFLPSDVPSSYEGKYGHIRYSVSATLCRPWRFDETITAMFEVISFPDLNYVQPATLPVQWKIEKNFGFLWSKSRPLQLTLSMPFTGFIPGQCIPITVEVNNSSKLQVSNIVIVLKEIITWKVLRTSSKKRKEKKELAIVVFEGINPNCSKSLNKTLQIPSIKIVNLAQCSIIKFSYLVTVEAHVGRFHKNLYGEFPVFLGNIPIQRGVVNKQHPVNLALNLSRNVFDRN